jgi:hypothetical protein
LLLNEVGERLERIRFGTGRREGRCHAHRTRHKTAKRESWGWKKVKLN